MKTNKKNIICGLLFIIATNPVNACDVIANSVEETCMDLANAVVASCETNFDQEAKDKKQGYKFNVCGNGKFELDIDTYFPYAATIEEVFTKYFLNGENIKKTSNLLQNTAPKIFINGKTYNGPASGLKGKAFTLETHPKKSISTKDFYSNCSLTSDGNSYTQTCNVSMTKGDGKDAFKSGKTNSTVIKCSKAQVGVECKVVVKGSPKDISGILYSNTAEKLAVSGAIETMRDIFNLSYLGHGCDPGPASENITKSTFYKNNIDTFWKKVTNTVETQTGKHGLVTVTSGTESFNIKTNADTKVYNEKNVNKVMDCQ
jgi:hypothetical protein